MNEFLNHCASQATKRFSVVIYRHDIVRKMAFFVVFVVVVVVNYDS